MGTVNIPFLEASLLGRPTNYLENSSTIFK
jgi:hypothetical protein